MNILFITSTRIGDAILSSSLLNKLITDYPESKITVACGKVAAPLFSYVPNVEEVIVLVKKKHSLHWFDLWKKVVLKKWDIVVDLRRSLMPFVVLTKKRCLQEKHQANKHRLETLSTTLKLKEPFPLKVWCSKEHKNQAEKIIPNDVPVIAIAPTANWNAKIWSPDYFVKLINMLTAKDGKFEDAKIFITGGGNEKAMVDSILKSFPPEKIIEQMGLDLLTTAAVFERCKLFVGNDSGLMHLASATNIPVVGLFGPTSDVNYAPYGKKSIAIRTPETVSELLAFSDQDKQTIGKLMTNLKPEKVYQEIMTLL